MTWITIPELSKATGLSEYMFREMAENGSLPTWQNPLMIKQGKRARYLVNSDDIKKFLLETLKFPNESVGITLKKLKIKEV